MSKVEGGEKRTRSRARMLTSDKPRARASIRAALLGLDFFVKYHPRGNSNCRFLVVNFSFDPSTMPKIVEVAFVHFFMKVVHIFGV